MEVHYSMLYTSSQPPPNLGIDAIGRGTPKGDSKGQNQDTTLKRRTRFDIGSKRGITISLEECPRSIKIVKCFPTLTIPVLRHAQ